MSDSQRRPQDRWPIAIAATACFVFGLWCLAFVQAAGDGTWYFYAKAVLQGVRLYSDLHLVQQPVFVLVNALGITIFGETFVGQKLIFVVVLGGYIYFAARLISRAPATGQLQALLFLSFFFVGIHFEAYRFDDYHAFENMMVLAVVNFVLDYMENGPRHPWLTATATGICLGLAVLTRINDGIVMLAVVSFFYAMRRRPAGVHHYLVLIVSLFATMGFIFAIIGETPTTWARATVFAAAAAKGGGASLLKYPTELVRNSLAYLFRGDYGVLLTLFVQALVVTYPVFFLMKVGSRRLRFLTGAVAAIGYALILWRFRKVDTISPFSAVAFLAALAFCVIRAPRWVLTWRDRGSGLSAYGREMLFLVPLALYLSGSMSSGGHLGALYFPCALVLVVWGIAFDGLRTDRLLGLLAAFALLQFAVVGFVHKVNNPYSWHGYRSIALTEPRVLTTAANLGVMPIEPRLLSFIAPICPIVKSPGSTLLSLPFPYANYFCGLPTWKNYAQTFFDTSSKATIDELIADLEAEPPQYILYQSQLANLSRHEAIYNAGKPLPHRALDEYIMQRLESGDWRVIATAAYGIDSTLGTGNLWVLIQPSQSRQGLQP